VSKRLKLLT